jgi:lysozyme
MRINPRGIELIKSFEGLRLSPYYCSGGVLTIGYGHTRDVRPGMRITKEQAEKLFMEDLERFERAVRGAVTVPIGNNMFAALVSFTYNVGESAFRKSTLLRRLNAGNFAAAANEFPRWNKSKGKVTEGLVRRRAAERALFLTPDSLI